MSDRMRNNASISTDVDATRSGLGLVGVTSLVANRVYDTQGNFVGKLEEIVIDARTGCIRHVVVAVGGIMGVGRTRLAVPWSVLTPNAGHGRCIVDVAQMRFTAVRLPRGEPWLQGVGATRGFLAAIPGSRRD